MLPLEKKERSQVNNISFDFKNTEKVVQNKLKASRKQVIINMWTKISEIEIGKNKKPDVQKKPIKLIVRLT